MSKLSASRVVAVEDASSEHSPQNLHEALQQINNRLGHLVSMSELAVVQNANLRVISRNTRSQAPLSLLPLQKTVPGYGRDLALPLVALAVLDAAGQQNFHAQCPPGGNAALIGSTPPNFDPTLEGYEDIDICKLVVFYNETFDIVPNDNLATRINKFRRFLSEF